MAILTLENFFWLSVFFVFYIYAGYPASVFIISKFWCKPVTKGDYFPSVTILIAAYNEEKHIEETVRNKLELDYPEDKLDIIVISDCSSDNTDQIVEGFCGNIWIK